MEGEWTATPPDKPGWYWWRKAECRPVTVVTVWVDRDTEELVSFFGTVNYGEWWSEPIQEPPA